LRSSVLSTSGTAAMAARMFDLINHLVPGPLFFSNQAEVDEFRLMQELTGEFHTPDYGVTTEFD
jgi:hypothetical protein